VSRPWDGTLRRVVASQRLPPFGVLVTLECGHRKTLSKLAGGTQEQPETWAICDECQPRRGTP
jgi:hypothetical protein